MDEANQEERVRQHQVAVAKSMGLPPAVLEVLSQTEDWQLREWLYICALDGFPFERLGEHARRKTDVATLCRVREDFWRDRVARAEAAQRESLQRDVASLGREVKEAGRESREARTAIENGVGESLKRKEREHAEEIRKKDAAIRSLKKQVADLEERLGLVGNAGKTDVWKTTGEAAGEKTPLDMRETAEGQKEDIAIQGMVETKGKPETFLQEVKNRLSARRRADETRRFIEKIATNKELGEGQVEYLLKCLEAGVSVREMERFAVPGIPVEMMRRLKELNEREPIQERRRVGRAESGRGKED